MIAYREQSNALDDIENRRPLLIADHITQQAPEQTDVGKQGGILIRG